jgi:putative ABC transport system permease protein
VSPADLRLAAEGGAALEALRIGLRSLLARKLRSLLTMLGMIFGVGAVIAMLSIGEGARVQALENIRLLGADNIIVDALPEDAVPEEDRQLNSPGLGLRDMEAMQGLLPDCRLSAVLTREASLQRGRSRLKAPLLGVEPGYLGQFPGMEIRGRWITPADERMRARVCVLGPETAARLFPGYRDPRGELVKIEGGWYTVVGTVQPRRAAGEGGADLQLDDLNRDVYIPFASYDARLRPPRLQGRVDRIVITVSDGEQVRDAASRVQAVLERRHHGARDTRTTVPWELIRQQQRTQRLFNLVMGAIASVSLLVGGIGIMNIMLSSVLERTREIGIRRSVGATAVEVLLQFVLESVLLAVGGGLIGVALGAGLAWGISHFADWQTEIRLWSVALAFGVSVLIGLVFGIYPARRAARLDPIEALRYE